MMKNSRSRVFFAVILSLAILFSYSISSMAIDIKKSESVSKNEVLKNDVLKSDVLKDVDKNSNGLTNNTINNLGNNLVKTPKIENQNDGAFSIGRKEYIKNDKTIKVDVASFIENGYTYVPIRYMATILDIPEKNIAYNVTNKSIKITKDNTIVSMVVNSKKMVVTTGDYSTTVDMEVPPIIHSNRTFLPARYIAEAFGYDISWDNKLKKVIIFRPKYVRIDAPSEPLYVGSYKKITVSTGLTKYKFDDLKFRVAEGDQGGVVSESRDATFNPKKPDFMLIAGYKPGKYTLEAVDSLGTVIAKANFEVSLKTSLKEGGPSFVGHGVDSMPNSGSSWGGGPEGLQNMNVNPAIGTRRIALVFVDTNEERFTTDTAVIDSFKTKWKNNITDGTAVGGLVKSLKKYYQESSLGNFDVSMQAFGPYHLDGNWDEVGAGAGWAQHAQAAITAADSDIDYSQFDTVLVVSQSVGAVGAAGAKYAWPTASIGEWNGWVTGDGPVSLGTIQMPNDWTERDGRQIFATASHELGHNLGLGDLYTPPYPGRNVGGWDLMDYEADLPNFTLPYKMRLGWIPESWVKAFNFASALTPVNQTITLKPVINGTPGAGNYVGAEIRLTDGLNYYFEYRKSQASKIEDLNLPSDNKILGVDTRSGSYEAPIVRPDVILLQNDSDGDGSVLGNGQDYKETDSSTPIYPVEFVAGASGIDGVKADLTIKYGVNDKPDPSLRPWGAPPWQSPDIEVRNARSIADSAWYNVPWSGNPNDVIAKVKNAGQLDAPGVRVNFYVKNYTVGGNPPETYLGTDVKDVSAGSTVEFKTNWIPPDGGHYCIVARIPLYVKPGTPSVPEMTELNNVAQSNYDRFISATASPAERRITKITVGNPYDKPAQVYVNVNQTNPLYRTYLEHKWLNLKPKEIREVTLMYEYVGKVTQPFEKDFNIKQYIGVANKVSVTGYVMDPNEKNPDHPILLGGAGTDIATGKATKFSEFSANGKTVNGAVTTKGGDRITYGSIILTVERQKGQKKVIENITKKTEGGKFSISTSLKAGDAVSATFVAEGYGDSKSKKITIK